jgi:hypothetical protein
METLDIMKAVDGARIRIAELQAQEFLNEYEREALNAHLLFVASFD